MRFFTATTNPLTLTLASSYDYFECIIKPLLDSAYALYQEHLLPFINEEAVFIRAVYEFDSDYSNFNKAYQISLTPNANSLTTRD